MVSQLDIPETLDDVSPKWLTRALRTGGVISEAAVEHIEFEQFARGSGQVALLMIRYDTSEEDAPPSIIIKLPSRNPLWRSEDFAAGFYQREIGFYQEIASESGFAVPRYYFSLLDEAAKNYVLLLEDVSPWQTGDNMEELTLNRAKFVLQQLARFHARWWNSSRLEQLDWLPKFNSQASYLADNYRSSWERFASVAGETLRPEVRELGERVEPAIASIMNRLSEAPYTLTHGDLHLRNLLFASSEHDSPFAVIDWQFVSIGKGAIDVGYFLVRAMAVENRRRHETELLQCYYNTLVECGVGGYEYTQFLEDYRLMWLHNFASFPIAVSTSDVSDELPPPFKTALERLTAAIRDLELTNLLPKGY